MDILLNQLIQFYLNNTKNLRHLTQRIMSCYTQYICWWRGTVVERRSLAGELSLSCARPAADG